MTIKCAIFDADGTLIDSMPMWRDLDYEFAALKGIPMTPESHAALNRLSLEQGAVYYRDVLGVPGTAEEICAEVEALSHEGYRRKVRPKPGAAEFLRRLRENGVRVAVATASSAVGVRACLEENGMAEFVDFFITCSDIGKSKEFPDIFLRCAEEFGASPQESVVFEDSLYALRTARAAGFPVVAVKDGDNGDETELRLAADRYLTGFEELLGEVPEAE